MDNTHKDLIRIFSLDGETELILEQNYMGQGRPGFTVKFVAEDGAFREAQFPLMPDSVIYCVRLLQEAEHFMLHHLYKHIAEEQCDELTEPRKPGLVLAFSKDK